jgi:carbon-monoxide dehydrogenase iron sulfur subunit
MVAGGRILVVDDEPMVTKSCRRVLSGQGYQVDTTESGQEGMRQAFDESFDLVFADLKMPDLDGMDLVRALRNQRPGTAVIIITGYGTVHSAVEAVKLGVSDYIEKPFEPDQIVEAARRALAARPEPEPPGARIEAELVKEVLRPAPEKHMVVVDVEKCLACKSCELACAVQHSRSGNLVEAVAETPKPKARLAVAQGEGFTAPLMCRHCEDAPCAAACPTGALSRPSNDGPVVVNQALCIGCSSCVLACPFGVVRPGDDGRSVIKCDQCTERVAEGELPACVSACPTHALQFKTVEEVLEEKKQADLKRMGSAIRGGGS